MMYDDELIDLLYDKMAKDKELMAVLKNPSSQKGLNLRIRRELTPLSEATAANVPFIAMYLSSSTETDNIYVTRAFLNIDFYASNRSEMKKLKSHVRRVLETENLLTVSQYNQPSETKGVYRYTQKYRPLIWA